MPSTTAVPDIELIIENTGGGGGGARPPEGGDDDGDDESHRRNGSPSSRRYHTGIAVGLVSILMFFMALACAFLVRKWTGTDWVPIHLPAVLWLNTLILLASSLTLELARHRLSLSDRSGFRKFWLVSTVLGVLFLVGQVAAWQRLVSQGVFLASNPASSFFYIFTGAHGVHLLGGIAALLYVSFRKSEKVRVSLPVVAELTSYYWHFMDGLWVFLLVLLYLGK